MTAIRGISAAWCCRSNGNRKAWYSDAGRYNPVRVNRDSMRDGNDTFCAWHWLQPVAPLTAKLPRSPTISDRSANPKPERNRVQVVEMRAPEWLGGSEMLYRLAYRDLHSALIR